MPAKLSTNHQFRAAWNEYCRNMTNLHADGTNSPHTTTVLDVSDQPIKLTLVLLEASTITSAVAALYKKYQAAPATKDGIPLPPGPPACWFWENAFPVSNMAHTLENLVAKYGPVMSLRQGSQVIIVIGRIDAATE
ncbi:hypothetical protein PAXINDRAFT_181013, partial [Paxillus involutus ATCC 200175]